MAINDAFAPKSINTGFGWVVAWFGFAQFLSALFPESPLRYAMYLTPFISVFIYILMRRGEIKEWFHPQIKTALICYIIAALISLPGLFDYGSKFLFIRDFLIISGFLITFLPKHNLTYTHALATFWAIALAGMLGFIKKGGEFGSDFDIMSSQGGMESSYAFTISIFVLFFLINRKFLMTLVSLAFMILFFKRAAMVGVIAVILIEFCVLALRQKNNIRFIQIGVLLGAGIAAVIGWNFISVINYLIDVIPELARSPETYLLGRYYLSGVLTEAYNYTPYVYHIFGHGVGTADRIAADAFGTIMQNPHNDHLKIIFEYGYLGMILVYIMLWKVHQGHRYGLYILFFNSLMFISDNLLIYYFHWFSVIILIKYMNVNNIRDCS